MGYASTIESVTKYSNVEDSLNTISKGSAILVTSANSGYYIVNTKIMINLEPVLFEQGISWWPYDDYYYSTQMGKLTVQKVAQGNDLNLYVNPAQNEEWMNIGVSVTANLLGAMLSTGVGAIGGPIAIGAGFVLSALAAPAINYLLYNYADTDVDDQHAPLDNNDRSDGRLIDYSVHDKWNYPTSNLYYPMNFVSKASAQMYYHWETTRNIETAKSYSIKITYQVEFGKPQSSSNPYISYLTLVSQYILSRTITQTIYI